MPSRCQNDQRRGEIGRKTAWIVSTHLLPSGLYRWSRSFTGSADLRTDPVADYTASGGRTRVPVISFYYLISKQHPEFTSNVPLTDVSGDLTVNFARLDTVTFCNVKPEPQLRANRLDDMLFAKLFTQFAA